MHAFLGLAAVLGGILPMPSKAKAEDLVVVLDAPGNLADHSVERVAHVVPGHAHEHRAWCGSRGALHPYDAKASGPPRWRAALERSRDGAHGEALLEFDDETFRLRLVDGLADHRLDLGADRPSRAA